MRYKAYPFKAKGKLSAISYQLSAISYQLSAISYQLSAIPVAWTWPWPLGHATGMATLREWPRPTADR
ncbi:MAG: hypothetical protein F6J90_33570 [Moorea sp. SIOASIH]|uniref:hypothetical protein n=1 Tax=Moorena sp. SIOASIH TaxID=2607817 RepID=UPI0013BBA3E1|nr:hypothetical protein [Moorena sp. SIOASIH]NEO40999.1 hypothetical protein [Moorena sp. SIOASIH]